ncbi:hypothetical protein MES5069_110064 [Mesorhizobium escarrei]|uniref:Uncharacterized protein n=1 Tax=Mesorhizobium escarrei TaxID=666018 RepID=A0ABM9DG07_9HYPH|nr:hypothetical protein MES5069_110064 [Mesorhizobium escarrei]
MRLTIFITLRIFGRIGSPSGVTQLLRITPGLVEKGVPILPGASLGSAQDAGDGAPRHRSGRFARIDHLA